MFLSLYIEGYAQNLMNYRKSSMYSFMLKHDGQEYCEEIVNVFNTIPVQDNFYDINLSKKVFRAGVLEDSDTTSSANQKPHIDALLQENAIGRRLVAKWFNQAKDGTFNCNLINTRGYSNVTSEDIFKAMMSVNTHQDELIQNVGEELIGNTYVLVNDISYGDRRSAREKRMNTAVSLSMVLSLIPVAGAIAPSIVAGVAGDYSGFNVTVTSYLYRLDWSEEIASAFYSAYYTETPDVNKKTMFGKEKGLFTLSYLGCQTVHSANANLEGINDREAQIRLVSTRAIDKAISLLQKAHPEFRVRTPLINTSPIQAHIGLREDVMFDSRYEVLEVSEKADGSVAYKRVAVIKPKKGKIWDNRYMAEFEEQKGECLHATEFELVSGNISKTACLIREIDN